MQHLQLPHGHALLLQEATQVGLAHTCTTMTSRQNDQHAHAHGEARSHDMCAHNDPSLST
jgi:hypothetical protein